MLENRYWVYILLCNNNNYYTGYTTDLNKRYDAHLKGKGAKYTRSFKPIKFGDKDDKQFLEALNILKGIDLYQKN